MAIRRLLDANPPAYQPAPKILRHADIKLFPAIAMTITVKNRRHDQCKSCDDFITTDLVDLRYNWRNDRGKAERGRAEHFVQPVTRTASLGLL